MKASIILAACIALGPAGCASQRQAHRPFHFDAAPAAGGFSIEGEVARAAPQVESFFGGRFRQPVRVTLVDSRAAFDASIPPQWGITPSQCWMVAAGVADRLIMMAPSAWAGHACDHKPGDIEEARSILRHELAHTFHGQHNSTRDFTGMDEAGWFVEGLAVLVSGQLTPERLAGARQAVQAGEGPASLAAAWSGRHRYGVAGSMVQYIEASHGRAALEGLLPLTTTGAIMERLGTSEADFLRDWRRWLGAAA